MLQPVSFDPLDFSLDDLPRVREQTVRALGSILQRRSKPFDLSILKASLIISMGTVSHLHSLKGKISFPFFPKSRSSHQHTYGAAKEQARNLADISACEVQALSVLFVLFNHILAFTKTLSLEMNQKKTGQSASKGFFFACS